MNDSVKKSVEHLEVTSAGNPPSANISSRLFLVRHGKSILNLEGRIQGQLDPPLSSLGQQQALKLAEYFSNNQLAAIYTSDLKRAQQTALPLAEAVGIEARINPELREIGLGEWQGKTGQEIRDEYPELWERWQKNLPWDLAPGGEGSKAFLGRVRQALYEWLNRDSVGDVLYLTHGGVIQSMLMEVMRIALPKSFLFRISNASITVLEKSDKGLVIGSVNDTAHLD